MTLRVFGGRGLAPGREPPLARWLAGLFAVVLPPVAATLLFVNTAERIGLDLTGAAIATATLGTLYVSWNTFRVLLAIWRPSV